MSDEDDDRGYASLPEEYLTESETPGLHRARESRHAEPPAWRSPKIADRVPCLVPFCRNRVEVTEEALESFVTFSKILRARGEEPLDASKTFCCASCGEKRRLEALNKSTKRRERVTEAIKYLKHADPAAIDEARVFASKGRTALRVSDAARAADERLTTLEKAMGAGYVQDLLTCIESKRSAAGQKKPRTKAADI